MHLLPGPGPGQRRTEMIVTAFAVTAAAAASTEISDMPLQSNEKTKKSSGSRCLE